MRPGLLLENAWRPAGLFLVCFSLLGSGRLAAAGEGTTGADFLNLVPGARSAALGGGYAAIGNDAESLFANPAGMLGLLNPQIGLSHLSWWEGITYDAAWGVQPLGELGALGVTAAYLNVLSFNSTEDPGLASEQAWDLLLTGSYALWLDRGLAMGVQVKYIMSRLSSETSWGLALDAGAQYFISNDQLALALVLRDLGFMDAHLASQDPLPMTMSLGVGYQFWPDDPYRFSLAGEMTLPLRGTPSGSLGVEGWLENLIALRVGVRTGQDAGDWLTVGTGVRWRSVHVDYALTPLGLLGWVHRFSLGYDFGSQRKLSRPKLSVDMVTKKFLYPDGEPGYTVQLIPQAHVAAGLDRWEAIIKDSRGRLMFRQQGAQTLPLKVVWKGRDLAGSRANVEGYYAYQLRVWDQQGYSALAAGEILPISITTLPKLKVLPRDIFAGQVSFRPKSMDNVKEWSIDIIGANGLVLKKYSGQGMIPKDFAWDGRDEQARRVAVKKGYHFVLRVRDEADNEIKSKAPLIVIDAGTKVYTDAGLALADQVPFHFEPTDIKIKHWVFNIIDRESGKVVRTYEGTAPLPETLIWDSRDERGRWAPSHKKYSFVLRMQDSLGNVWQQASVINTTRVKVLSRDKAALTVKIEQILFDFNQAELKPSMSEKLRKIADLTRAHPPETVKLIIEGHTDEIGTTAYNMELSFKRANMVMRYLVEDESLPSAQMKMQGYGKGKPLQSGAAPGQRARNRRVEVTLVLPSVP